MKKDKNLAKNIVDVVKKHYKKKKKLTWNERFKIMKKELGLKNADIAKITGLKVESIRNVTSPKRKFSRWLKLTIHIHEKMQENELERKV